MRRAVFVDFEATGTNPHRADPIEVAALAVEGREIVARMATLIRPGRSVPAAVTRLTGITDAMVAGAPGPDAVAAELAAFIDGAAAVVAHNAAFDRVLLHRILGRPVELWDSCELACLLRPDLASHRLTALREALGQSGPAHRAEADAEATHRVVLALLDGFTRASADHRRAVDGLQDWPWLSLLPAADTPAPVVLPPRLDRGHPTSPVDSRELEAFFADRGPLARALPGYHRRAGQLDVAHEVNAALAGGEHAMIEAGTGSGKTLGYLVPLVLFARKNRLQVAVSTATLGLQDQLDRHDLPLTARAVAGDTRWQVLKGRANYACLRRIDDLRRARRRAPFRTRLALAYLGAFAAAHPEGDLDQLSGFMLRRCPELAELRDQVRDVGCRGRGHCRCPRARVSRRARRAHVLVVNHALLATGAPELAGVEHLVVDEAHLLETRAIAALSQTVTGPEIQALATALPRGGKPLQRASAAVAAAVASLAEERADSPLELPLEEALRADGGNLAIAIAGLRDQLDRSPAHELQGRLRAVLSGGKDHVRLVTGDALDPTLWTLRAEPLDVAGALRTQLFGRRKSVILTSGTLALGDSGRFVQARVGYPAHARPLRVAASSTDRQVASLLVSDLPGLRRQHEHILALARVIETAARLLRGRTLALFTSTRRRAQVAERLRPPLARLGITVLEQDRDGPRARLVDQMRSDAGTVLLGCHSFWHGIDIPGVALSCVVVERVPFEAIDRPAVAARMKREGPGFAGFTGYLLPRALMELRQGVGRLVRGPGERGVVILCHEELVSRSYADRVMEVLAGDVELVGLGDLAARLEQVLGRMDLAADCCHHGDARGDGGGGGGGRG